MGADIDKGIVKVKSNEFGASLEQVLSDPAFKSKGYLIAQCTNRLFVEKISENILEQQINCAELGRYGLDIRVFNEDGEVCWRRGSIGDREFYCRERRNDVQLTEGFDYWDEEQYLDIDTQKSKSPDAVTTGGGRYFLPLEKYEDAKVKIRNYLSEEENGTVYISDWRVVEFS